jgi:hypothetical protein
VLFSENGFGAMCMKERHGGELWWTLNLVGCGVGGVLMNMSVRIGWGFGRISEGVGDISKSY